MFETQPYLLSIPRQVYAVLAEDLRGEDQQRVVYITLDKEVFMCLDASRFVAALVRNL